MQDLYDQLTHLYSGPMAGWGAIEWFLLCAALFLPLAFFASGKRKQPRFRRDMVTDMLYWFAGPFLYIPVYGFLVTFLFSFGAVRFIQIHWGLAQIPLLVQVLIILLLTDFLQYWAHRAFHRAPLWKFHAIHHSAPHVDWLTSARFHPVNLILYSTAVNALVVALGFSADAFMVLLPFNVIYSPLVHANLDWTYGPFKYVLASPVYHRWHHTHPGEGGNKNFAPNFPFIDLMFGTFYMPEGKIPENFGTPYDPISGNILGQLAYPFLPRRKDREKK